MKLLIIDDDPGMAALLARTTRKLGHQAVVGHSAGEALHRMAEGADIVIVDASLESMDSVELVAVLRGIAPQVAVAFLAGAGEVMKVSHVGMVFPRMWNIVQRLSAQGRADPVADPAGGVARDLR